MGEKILTLQQHDELNLRIGFLQEVFHILHEVRESESLTLVNFETLLLDTGNKLDEIQAILDGKGIIPRNDETVFGMN